MLNSQIFTIERQIFEHFLQEVKTLMTQKRIKPPSGFISYAWESPPNGVPNKTLQAWLSQLKKDFAALNIDLFLDIQNINGDMRAAMREIKSRDFVFLIGTPRFKERAEQDSLYRLPTFNPQLLSMTGNAVVMVENSDKIYVVEKNNQQLLLIGETTLPQANSTQIEWKQEMGYQRAQNSEGVHNLIEQALKQVSSKSITNVAYEFGLTLDKVKQFPQALMPLLYQGDFGVSFPQDISSSILIRDFREPKEYYRNFISTSTLGLLPAICPQLQTDKDYAKLVDEFLEWKFEVWKEQLTHRFREQLKLYIPAHGDDTEECQNPKPMLAHLEDFMRQQAAKVLLVLGGSGSGKTTFSQYLTRLTAQQPVTPIWISLPALQNPKERLMEEGLTLLGVPASHMPSFKQKELLIILDGYDQVKDLGNLYNSNDLHHWNAKVLITCRIESLGNELNNSDFAPSDGHYQTLYLAPFSLESTEKYIKKYIEINSSTWLYEHYKQEIEQFPSIKEIIKTPLLLNMAMYLLPDIKRKHQGLNKDTPKMDQVICEEFIIQWLKKHLAKCDQEKLRVLDDVVSVNNVADQPKHEKRLKFLRECMDKFAESLYFGQVEVMSEVGNDPFVKELILSLCPLERVGINSYRFTHKWILDYLVFRVLNKDINQNTNVSSNGYRNLLTELNKSLLNGDEIQQQSKILNKPESIRNLWQIIEASKIFSTVETAAANSISILNKIGVNFSEKDLRGVRISGADLTGVIFDNTNLAGANMDHVRLSSAWLRNAKLDNASMKEVKLFKESLCYALESPNNSVVYNENSGVLAVVQSSNVRFYNINQESIKLKFQLLRQIKNVYLSPTGKLCLCVEDKQMQLWNINEIRCINGAYDEHKEGISDACFSSDEQYFASAENGHDIVNIWSANTGKLHLKMKCGGIVKSVRFDIHNFLAAVASDKDRIKIWNIWNEGLSWEIDPQFKISCIDFRDKKVGIGSETGGLKVFNSNTNKLKIYAGHQATVNDIQIGPQAQASIFVSCSSDKTVKLWDIENCWLLNTFNIETEVRHVSFSHDGNKLLITSATEPEIIMYFLSNSDRRLNLHAHRDSLVDLQFSTDGQLLFSTGRDNTLKFWSINNMEVLKFEQEREIASPFIGFDGNLLAYLGANEEINLYNQNDNRIYSVDLKENAYCVQIKNSKWLVYGAADKIGLWKMGNGNIILGEHINATDGSLVVDTQPRYDRSNFAFQFTSDYRSSVNLIQFSSDGNNLAFQSTSPSKVILLRLKTTDDRNQERNERDKIRNSFNMQMEEFRRSQENEMYQLISSKDSEWRNFRRNQPYQRNELYPNNAELFMNFGNQRYFEDQRNQGYERNERYPNNAEPFMNFGNQRYFEDQRNQGYQRNERYPNNPEPFMNFGNQRYFQDQINQGYQRNDQYYNNPEPFMNFGNQNYDEDYLVDRFETQFQNKIDTLTSIQTRQRIEKQNQLNNEWQQQDEMLKMNENSEWICSGLFRHDHDVTSLHFSPCSSFLAVGTTMGLNLWSLALRIEGQIVEGSENRIIDSVQFAPESLNLLVYSASDNTMRLQSYKAANRFAPEIIHLPSTCHALSFRKHNNEYFLASGHADHAIRYWKLIPSTNNRMTLSLLWSTHQNVCCSQGVSMENAVISDQNKNMLVQWSKERKSRRLTGKKMESQGRVEQQQNNSQNIVEHDDDRKTCLML